MSVLEKFLNDNKMLLESPIECDLNVGDVVIFTNDYGVSFANMIVIGFAKPEHQLHGRFIHISSDCAWFPCTRESLKIQARTVTRDLTVTYPNGETREFKTPA